MKNWGTWNEKEKALPEVLLFVCLFLAELTFKIPKWLSFT